MAVPIWFRRFGPGNSPQPAKIIVVNRSCAPLMTVPVFNHRLRQVQGIGAAGAARGLQMCGDERVVAAVNFY